MAGVVVTTEARAQARALLAPSGQLFIVGQTERGDTTKPILVNSMSDAKVLLGDRVTYGSVYDQLRTFFAEGGKQAYVARVVGATASAGTLTITDRAGTPVPTLRFDAASAGSWSGNLKIEVADGNVANTFKVIVTLNGVVVHSYNNLASPAAAVAKFSGSPYVRATDLGSATAAPANNPKVTAATVLTSGNDQRGTIVAADYVSALARFGPDLGTGAVAVPGQANATVWAGIIAHCESLRRVGLLAEAVATSISDYQQTAGDYDSEYAGLFGPWVTIPDETGIGQQTISPEGYVAAVRARAHEQVGPWRVPAGSLSKANFVTDLEAVYTADDIQALEEANVSPIRRIAGSIRLYGWASLSSDQETWGYLKDRDLLNFLVYQAEEKLEPYVFETIDARGRLLSDIQGALINMVDPIRSKGGLYENINPVTKEVIDPGYKIVTDASVNTPESLRNNEVHADLSVRISPTAGLITLRIVKVGILSSF